MRNVYEAAQLDAIVKEQKDLMNHCKNIHN